ncbi:MAG: Si-specific NAD(P)(+) transhydrogenase, partial [Alphaproteobacteria bacterium]|nr:Si-specific NAD(P)(+) transhydrogenase [Alphaproteobacteria bacterium]
MFAALGIKVTLVEGRERLLTFMDAEVANVLAQCMRALGVELYLGETIERVESGSGASFQVALKSG